MLQWIISVIHERPKSDYEHFIQDGSVLSKLMTSIVFNSVPLEQIDDNWGTVSFKLLFFFQTNAMRKKDNQILRIIDIPIGHREVGRFGDFTI